MLILRLELTGLREVVEKTVFEMRLVIHFKLLFYLTQSNYFKLFLCPAILSVNVSNMITGCSGVKMFHPQECW